jgi:uncharacterized coiled-coil protein SlyX
MSRYRDDQEAARHRIESLEDKLRVQDTELEEHREELAEREREIVRLSRELRCAGTARIGPYRRTSGARFVVAGAMSAAIVAGTIGFLSVHRTVTPPTVTFAEFRPPNMPLATPRMDHGDARTDAIVRARHIEALDRILTSNASIDDLRTLRNECARTNDEPCLVAADKHLSPSDD